LERIEVELCKWDLNEDQEPIYKMMEDEDFVDDGE